jgi:hypothetical protein
MVLQNVLGVARGPEVWQQCRAEPHRQWDCQSANQEKVMATNQ